MRNTLLVCAVIALAPSLAMAQQTQLSVTTASPEALALYQKALDYVENVESASARPLLDQAIQKDPGFAMAYALRAITGDGFNVTRQNREKALSLVEKVSPGERQWIMAAQAQADGNIPKMKQHLVELLKLHPNDQHVAYFAGNAARLVDDAEALTYFKRATTIDPTFAAPYNQIGYIQLRKGDFAAAERALKQYIANRPDSANPYDSYAELLLRMGRYDESIAQYEKALTKSPTFAGSLMGIGHNNVFKGHYVKARESYKRLHDTGNAPDKADSLYWVAVSFVHEGKPAEALQALEQQREFATAEKLTPTAMSAHLDQAWLLSESGEAADARAHIDKVEAMLKDAVHRWGEGQLAPSGPAGQGTDCGACQGLPDCPVEHGARQGRDDAGPSDGGDGELRVDDGRHRRSSGQIRRGASALEASRSGRPLCNVLPGGGDALEGGRRRRDRDVQEGRQVQPERPGVCAGEVACDEGVRDLARRSSTIAGRPSGRTAVFLFPSTSVSPLSFGVDPRNSVYTRENPR
jgi:tetratricopeptide (TPR) repeat protein